ncbi:MAG: N-acetylmuramoyl-L-alanine amidase [Gemmatimonadales bacterium]|jgi:N-acetylmuramoyl-L-alanine amidase
MRAALLALLFGALTSGAEPPAPPAPTTITVATARGSMAVPVAMERGHPALPAPLLQRLLPVAERRLDGWAFVDFADQPFQFLLGAPVLLYAGRLLPLVGGAYVARDTLFVPLQWLTEYIPAMFAEGYRYDPRAARFEEVRLGPVVTASYEAASELGRRSGFRMAHLVVLDAGHGGVDNGNPGRYLPRGVQEKHVNLAIAKLLRTELEAHGIDVLMTRSTDTLIDLRQRAPMCRNECDLFVSIHVNSMPRRRGYERINGVETYFLGDALTEEARRVAEMENEALRYETGAAAEMDADLAFIFKDLHTNEFLRESALLADLVQSQAAVVHPGEDRGVSQNRFVVLATATRPAILLETGFATNRRDGAYLASTEGQRELAKAAAAGIVEYLRQYESKVLVGTER